MELNMNLMIEVENRELGFCLLYEWYKIAYVSENLLCVKDFTPEDFKKYKDFKAKISDVPEPENLNFRGIEDYNPRWLTGMMGQNIHFKYFKCYSNRRKNNIIKKF